MAWQRTLRRLGTGWRRRLLPTATSEEERRLEYYRYETHGEQVHIHLRREPDGRGTLLINASRVLHLNPTATLMASLLLQGHSEPTVLRALRRRYRVGRAQALADLRAFRQQLFALLRPDEVCPLHDLEVDTWRPFQARPSAPYRMDLAVTYRCNNDCAHCYNVAPHTYRPRLVDAPPDAPTATPVELSTAAWKRVLNRLWQLGIPHVVFTGGEPTLRSDLPELIAHAAGLGMVVGLNTNGRRLADAAYVDRLVAAGLDHVQITLESSQPAVHNRMVGARAFEQTVRGIRNALDSPLYVMTNTTMLRTNAHTLADTLDFLAALGVPTVGLNALIHAGRGAQVGTGLPERELHPLLELARAKTAAHGQRLIWYTPTRYCHFDPMQLDLGVKGCTAALYNLCLEPDGAVLPCQSYYQPLGNILTDAWEDIWNHPLAVRLRERRGLPAACADCALLTECGGGCPLTLQADGGVHETACTPVSPSAD